MRSGKCSTGESGWLNACCREKKQTKICCCPRSYSVSFLPHGTWTLISHPSFFIVSSLFASTWLTSSFLVLSCLAFFFSYEPTNSIASFSLWWTLVLLNLILLSPNYQSQTLLKLKRYSRCGFLDHNWGWLDSTGQIEPISPILLPPCYCDQPKIKPSR